MKTEELIAYLAIFKEALKKVEETEFVLNNSDKNQKDSLLNKEIPPLSLNDATGKLMYNYMKEPYVISDLMVRIYYFNYQISRALESDGSLSLLNILRNISENILLLESSGYSNVDFKNIVVLAKEFIRSTESV